MIYLTLVVFFGFLLVIWVVVKLLFNLSRHDTFHFDRQHVWETHSISKEDMYPPGPRKRNSPV